MREHVIICSNSLKLDFCNFFQIQSTQPNHQIYCKTDILFIPSASAASLSDSNRCLHINGNDSLAETCFSGASFGDKWSSSLFYSCTDFEYNICILILQPISSLDIRIITQPEIEISVMCTSAPLQVVANNTLLYVGLQRRLMYMYLCRSIIAALCYLFP